MLAYFGTGSSLLLETTDGCDTRELLSHLSSVNTKTRKQLEYKPCRCAHQQRMGLEHSRFSMVICRINERGQAGGLSHLLRHHQVPGEPEVARDWEHWLSSLAILLLEMTAVVRIVRTMWLEGRSGHHTHLLKHRPSV